MKIFWPIFLLLLLSACGTGTSPGADDGDDDNDNGTDTGGSAINETAGLSSYPGATEAQVSEEGLDTRTRFSADATLQQVYDFFNGELSAQGWQQTEIEIEDDEIESGYVREGRELELELERDDGGFELEIDIDGDNAGFDEDNGVGDGDDDDGDDDGDDT